MGHPMTRTDTRTNGHPYRGVSVSVRVGMSRDMSGTCPALSGLSGYPPLRRVMWHLCQRRPGHVQPFVRAPTEALQEQEADSAGGCSGHSGGLP